MEFILSVNGFEGRVRYPDSTVEDVLIPLLRDLSQRQQCERRRLIVFLAAPPGTGKSTLAAAMEVLAQRAGLVPVQALGMDGFHFHQEYLNAHTALRAGEEILLARIKGAPESFDVEKLRFALLAAREGDPLWPVYDRRLHDVVEDAVQVTAPILIVEGNWLLLDRPGWRALPCDESIFIRAREEQLRERLIARKERGGLARVEAEAWYAATDGPNVGVCLRESRPADRMLSLGDDGALFQI